MKKVTLQQPEPNNLELANLLERLERLVLTGQVTPEMLQSSRDLNELVGFIYECRQKLKSKTIHIE